jgi:LPS sulfotransferase NodH
MPGIIILSYGRSGSVLLAHNVGRNVGSLPTYAKGDFFSSGTVLDSDSPVIHSHLMLSADNFAGYQIIFNLRADPSETVLSFMIANHYKQYHKFKDQELPASEPFYVDPVKIKHCCQRLIAWHNYYANQLTVNDMVIVYEHMINLLTTSVYDPIYPDKDKILLNYFEAKKICSQYQDQMLDSINRFLLHKNTKDIKNYINYTD